MAAEVLVAGANTEIGGALCAELARAGRTVIAAARVSTLDQQPTPCEPAAATVAWHAPSQLATRSLVLQVTASWPGLAECIVVQDPNMGEPRLLHELHLYDIDRGVDEHLKSYLFLAREVLRHYADRPDDELGVLGMVGTIGATDHRGRGQGLPPLAAAVAGGFNAAIDALSVAQAGARAVVHAFEPAAGRASGRGRATDYARFVVDSLREHGRAVPGRRFRFSTRATLLSGRRRG